ncbi:MAG: hypothetical protein QG673_1533 [Pseudomonadota bacterium]|nr:hypothetical protein [Burkholderiales bacterium]MDQ5921475.1 hypothetical protein [Pseudomonadota bacterium]
MDIREQRNHSQAQELINLANDVLADWCGTTRLFNYKNPYDNPKFKELAKLERKFNKHHKNKLVDVGEYLEKFSIELRMIPKNLHFLMRVIGWLDEDTYAPCQHIKGFYPNSYHDSTAKDLSTKTWYYITVEQYISLLFIDCELRERYKPQELAA